MNARAAHRWLFWADRSGRFSWLRAIVFLLALLPAIWMAYKWQAGLYSPKPLTDILREAGDWTIRFLLITLAVSPLRTLSRWNSLIAVRRMLGLFALFYLTLHLAFYVIEQNFVWLRILLEIALRTYLTIGFAAVLILFVMGLTSNDYAIRRLGPKTWRRIHWWVYAAALLGLVHFFLQVRIKAYEPSLLAGVCILLAGFRLLYGYGRHTGWWQLCLLTIFAAVCSAFVEAAYYTFSMNAPLLVVLQANFDFSYEIRPAYWVLVLGVLMMAAKTVGLYFLRQRTA